MFGFFAFSQIESQLLYALLCEADLEAFVSIPQALDMFQAVRINGHQP